MKNKIKNIIFDLGGVLLDISLDSVLRELKERFATQLPFDPHKGLVLSEYPFFVEYEVGQISSEEFLAKFRQLLNTSASDDELIDVWNKMLVGFPKGRLDCVYSLKEKYRLFLLSNTNEIHVSAFSQMALDENAERPLTSCFEKIYYSHEIHCRKPDEEPFQLVIAENDLKPHETLFIDDFPANITTAQKLGLHTEFATSDNTVERIFQKT